MSDIKKKKKKVGRALGCSMGMGRWTVEGWKVGGRDYGIVDSGLWIVDSG